MAATNIDTWPRDSVADANPDLTRKRQRLSEEADDASPPSDNDDIVIEALPLEEDGDCPATAIELSDDLNSTMAAFSDAFVLDSVESIVAPFAQINWLRERLICKDAFITPRHFHNLTCALSDHIEIARKFPDLGRGKYTLEQDFFDILGEACYMIVTCTQPFMNAKLVENYAHNMCRIITDFIQVLHEICVHALRVIPSMMEKTLSRRDSGVGGRTTQRPPLLWFVRVLAETLRSPFPISTAYFRQLGYVKPKLSRNQRRDQFLQQDSTLWLKKLLDKLVDYDQNLRGDGLDAQVWEATCAVLRIVDSLGNDLPLPFIDPVLQVMQRHMFKVIAGLKSADLPNGIHELCVRLSCNLLDLNMKRSDVAQLARTYDDYVADSEGAPFLLDNLRGKTTIECLRHISDDDIDTMKELIATGWMFDKLDLFIHSSLMDVRNIGITLLGVQLLEVFNKHSRTFQGLTHPVLQYTARFMRSKKLVDHIYGPESHHSLIAHSQGIICFLAAVSEYRNDDTDTIWHTCTDSKEAEKIRASVSIIHQLLQNLDYDQMVYLARRYTTTESSRLSKDVIQLLGTLFGTIRAKAKELELDLPLETAFISVEIYLNHEVDELRNIAMTELLWFTHPAACRADDRILLYKRLVPEAAEGTSRGTAAAHILSVFLERAPCSPEEGQILLCLLPPQAAIEGLSSFVQSCRTADDEALRKIGVLREQRLAIATRLNVVFRLIALLGTKWNDDAAKNHLFDVAFGKLALDNDSRDLAWQSLLSLSKLHATAVASVAQDVRDHYLTQNALQVEMAFVTPQLIHLIGCSFLKNSFHVRAEKDIMPAFEQDMWKHVLAGVESSDNVQVNEMAAQIVCQTLCDPATKRPAQLNSQFQSEFTRSHINRICEGANRPSKEHDRITCRQLALLEAVLYESCKHLSCSISTALGDISLGPSPDQDSLCCTLQIYGTGPEHPRIFQIRASPQATVSELAVTLPQITGANENRVILSGKLLDLCADSQKSLAAAGLKSSGVIQVSPKHTYTSNLDDLLTPVSAIESQIMRQYSSLEQLLYRSEQVARKAYILLAKVRPPSQERQRITQAAASFADICPRTAPWRTALTTHTLQTHLVDFARICVVDADFFRHGTRLLVAIIMDEDRVLEPSILVEVMECLIVFLRERTDETATIELVSDPDAFVARMAVICLEVCQQDLPSTPMQCLLAERTFMALIQASQHQTAVWSSFKRSPLTQELHAGLFFSANDDICHVTMNTIRNLCKQCVAAPEFYTNELFTLTGRALQVQIRAAEYFELMNDVMLEDFSLRKNEKRAREVTNELTSRYLQQYQDLGTVDLPRTDPAIAGLLKVLQTSVDMLNQQSSFTGSNLSNYIFNYRLFPLTLGVVPLRVLLDVETRRIAYQLVQSMHLEHCEIAGLLENCMREMLTLNNDPTASFPGRDFWLRPAWKHSGLQNLGMTCYMNALLQQLFANVHFRQFIFSLPLDTNRQRILAEVRKLFAHMQSGYFEVPNTAPLANALDIEPGVMEDVHTFYANLLARLESEMPNAESKARLNSFYGGKQLSQTMGECGHISSKEETFGEIGLTVQHKSGLLDSLNEWVQGEAMEGANKYRCSACDSATDGRLVNAMKRLSIEELSDNITFCLKRFKFDLYGGSVKINDRFEFPQFIDMARYTRKYLEKEQSPTDDDIFELVGVIVQKGQLDFGHYWSYTLIRNTASPESREWVKLDDSNTFRVEGGLAEVRQECFGDVDINGNQRADNAYVLFYQRKRVLEEQIADDPIVRDARTAFLLPPTIPLPPEQLEFLHEENVQHQKVTHLFDDDFSQFVEWLATKAEYYWRNFTTDDRHVETLTKQETGHIDSENMMQLAGKALTVLLQRVIACDKNPVPKLNSMLVILNKLLSASATVANNVVCQILEEVDWFQKVIINDCAPLRRAVYDILLTCLRKLKASDSGAYSYAVRSVTNTHSVYLQQDLCPAGGDYITFAADLASLGADEILRILQEGYLSWAMDILKLPGSSIRQKARSQTYELVKKDRSVIVAAYKFINRLLESGVQLDSSSGKSCAIKTDAGVLLSTDQYDQLLCTNGRPRDTTWWLSSARFAVRLGSWESFEPGKLLVNLCKLVPEAARLRIENNLLGYVATEDTSFLAIIRLVMHYLALQPPKQQAVDVCGALAKTVLEWDGVEGDFTAHIEDLYGLSKVAVLASFNGRLLRFLEFQKADARVRTANWLAKDVFTGPAITEATDLDEERAQRAKEVIETACPLIRKYYNEERARSCAEPMIKASTFATQHLHRLQEEAVRIRADQDDESQLPDSAPPTISRKLSILIDEAPRVAEIFHSQYRDFIKFWIGEQPVSHSTNGVQDSAEASEEEDVDDDVSSDAGYDEDDDDDVMTFVHA